MINRYQGNSGRVTKVEEVHRTAPLPATREASIRPRPSERRAPGINPVPKQNTAAGSLGGVFEKLGRILPVKNGKLSLETEDIILLLVLYLMYRESGDQELLMIMGAIFLL